jgi:chromosomal replication initiation ATPase DnaA
MLRRTKDRTIAKARDIAIYLSRDLSGVSCRELGEVLVGYQLLRLP